MDKLWHFVIGPTGSVLFSEHLPLLRLNLLLLRLPPSVRPPLFTHISISLFFHGSVALRARSRHVVILTAAPQAYILLLLALHICSSYIYMYTYYYLLLPRIYICIYIYEHIVTRAHTYTYTIFLYVYSYIFTQLHIYYIIVLYVSEKERPVDYGRSAFLMSE